MIDLNVEELVSLYFHLSDIDNLSENLDNALMKIERLLFELFTVKEIEEYRSIYNNKEKS